MLLEKGGNMNLSVQWDIKDLLQASDRMAAQKHLPEFIAKTVAVSMRDLAENNARKNLGNVVIGIL